jgi:hypothetical protein
MLFETNATNDHVNANEHVQVPSIANEPIDANEQV